MHLVYRKFRAQAYESIFFSYSFIHSVEFLQKTHLVRIITSRRNSVNTCDTRNTRDLYPFKPLLQVIPFKFRFIFVP